MAVISFSFTSVHAELSKPAKGKIKIGNNISITSVEKAGISLADVSKDGVKVGFEFKTSYSPDIGFVLLKGHVIYLQEKEAITKILDIWKKNKTIEEEAGKAVMSAVLDKSNIQALFMTREVGLPSPIPLPKVKVEEKKK